MAFIDFLLCRKQHLKSDGHGAVAMLDDKIEYKEQDPMTSGGKRPHYLPDLLFHRTAEPMPDTLDEYHEGVTAHIEMH